MIKYNMIKILTIALLTTALISCSVRQFIRAKQINEAQANCTNNKGLKHIRVVKSLVHSYKTAYGVCHNGAEFKLSKSE